MAKLLDFSEAGSIALHAVVCLGANPDRRIPSHELAKTLRVSSAHLSKVMQRLARVGVVDSMRGPTGGFVLGRPAEEIVLLDVYEAIAGPLEETACLFQSPVCGGRCILGELIDNVDNQVRQYLSATTVSDAAQRYGACRREDGGPQTPVPPPTRE